MDSQTARRRLIRDFKKIQQDPPYGVSGTPVQNDLMRWRAIILGPEDTPWDGGTFQLQLDFDEHYPSSPPKIKFLSPMFHPNVYFGSGNICLDILQNEWSPVYDPSAILVSIQSLLSDPNPSSPANVEAACLYLDNRREYNNRVLACVKKSWQVLEEDAELHSDDQGETESHAADDSAAIPSEENFLAASSSTDVNSVSQPPCESSITENFSL